MDEQQEKKENAEKTPETKAVCDRCGKPIASTRQGSLTSWLFDTRYKVATDSRNCSCDIKDITAATDGSQSDVPDIKLTMSDAPQRSSIPLPTTAPQSDISFNKQLKIVGVLLLLPTAFALYYLFVPTPEGLGGHFQSPAVSTTPPSPVSVDSKDKPPPPAPAAPKGDREGCLALLAMLDKNLPGVPAKTVLRPISLTQTHLGGGPTVTLEEYTTDNVEKKLVGEQLDDAAAEITPAETTRLAKIWAAPVKVIYDNRNLSVVSGDVKVTRELKPTKKAESDELLAKATKQIRRYAFSTHSNDEAKIAPALRELNLLGPCAIRSYEDVAGIAVRNHPSQWRALLTLGAMGPAVADRAVPTLIAALKDPHCPNFTKSASCWSLGEMGTSASSAKDILKELAATSDNAILRRHAEEALKKI